MIALHYYRRIWLIGFLLIIVVSACHTLSLPERILYYHQPAEYFEEALPLGNGRIGATVYGGVKTEQILLNEETLWAGGPVDPAMNPTAYEHLPAVRRALFQGDYKEADRLVQKIQGKFSESYAPLGDLFIEMNHDSVYSDYNRELDLRRALASVQYRVGDVHYTREVFVSHPHQVLAIHLKAIKKYGLTLVVMCSR